MASENGVTQVQGTIETTEPTMLEVMGDAECEWDFARVDYTWARRLARAFNEFRKAGNMDDFDKFEALQDSLYKLFLEVLVTVPEHWLNDTAPAEEEIDWRKFESLSYLQPQYFGRLMGDIQLAMGQAAKS